MFTELLSIFSLSSRDRKHRDVGWIGSLPMMQSLQHNGLQLSSEHDFCHDNTICDQESHWVSKLLAVYSDNDDGADILVKAVADHLGFAEFDCSKITVDAIAIEYLDYEPVRLGHAVPFFQNGQLSWVINCLFSSDWCNQTLLGDQQSTMLLALPSSWSELQEKIVSLQAGHALAKVSSLSSIRRGSMMPYLQMMLSEADRQQCSDVHLYAVSKHFCSKHSVGQEGEIRFRCNGMMLPFANISEAMMQSLIACIKLAANLDVTEYRRPQDGSLRMVIDSTSTVGGVFLDQSMSEADKSLSTKAVISVRVSIIPGFSGEKVVLRLLKSTPAKLEKLGLNADQMIFIKQMLLKPQGLILIAGPTGCGKSTSLQAMLAACDCESRHIISLEDPIEVPLKGVHQVSIQPQLSLDFSDLLPRVLRHDPDVIMVGEVRDQKTAELVMSAAQTGHLVLTSIHGGSVSMIIQRLMSLTGEEWGTVLSSVCCLIEQRLIRMVCLQCAGDGCEDCQQGYSGRIGIFACYDIAGLRAKGLDEATKILSVPSGGHLIDQAVCLKKQGKTTQEEIDRVFG